MSFDMLAGSCRPCWIPVKTNHPAACCWVSVTWSHKTSFWKQDSALVVFMFFLRYQGCFRRYLWYFHEFPPFVVWSYGSFLVWTNDDKREAHPFWNTQMMSDTLLTATTSLDTGRLFFVVSSCRSDLTNPQSCCGENWGNCFATG